MCPLVGSRDGWDPSDRHAVRCSVRAPSWPSPLLLPDAGSGLAAPEDPAEHKPAREGADCRRGDGILARRLPGLLRGFRYRLWGGLLDLSGDRLGLRGGYPFDLVLLRCRLGLCIRGLLLGLLLDVGLVGELGDRLAEILAGGLDLGLDLLRGLFLGAAARGRGGLALAAFGGHQVRASFALRLTYPTPSLVVSIARSGTAGTPSSTCRFPSSAATPATAP